MGIIFIVSVLDFRNNNLAWYSGSERASPNHWTTLNSLVAALTWTKIRERKQILMLQVRRTWICTGRSANTAFRTTNQNWLQFIYLLSVIDCDFLKKKLRARGTCIPVCSAFIAGTAELSAGFLLLYVPEIEKEARHPVLYSWQRIPHVLSRFGRNMHAGHIIIAAGGTVKSLVLVRS